MGPIVVLGGSAMAAGSYTAYQAEKFRSCKVDALAANVRCYVSDCPPCDQHTVLMNRAALPGMALTLATVALSLVSMWGARHRGGRNFLRFGMTTALIAGGFIALAMGLHES